jgi:hypothetical protein
MAQKIVIPENYELLMQNGINENYELEQWGYVIFKDRKN